MQRIIMVAFIFLSTCNSKQANQQDSTDNSKKNAQDISTDTSAKPKNIWVDRLNNKKYPLPDSINNKPISFYLDNPKIAAIAKSFYKGQFRPTDNDSTTELLSYVTTDDNTIRLFYRWCLDFTITISDGALAEYPGGPALKYATKFPKEFFDYMDKDTSGQRYRQWAEIIAYSGLSDYNKKDPEIEEEIISNMFSNCYSCNDKMKSRIVTLAKDITKAVKLQD